MGAIAQRLYEMPTLLALLVLLAYGFIHSSRTRKSAVWAIASLIRIEHEAGLHDGGPNLSYWKRRRQHGQTYFWLSPWPWLSAAYVLYAWFVHWPCAAALTALFAMGVYRGHAYCCREVEILLGAGDLYARGEAAQSL